MTTYRAMRKAAAHYTEARNPVFHAVAEESYHSRAPALCGAKGKSSWVDCGLADSVTCPKCRRALTAGKQTEGAK